MCATANWNDEWLSGPSGGNAARLAAELGWEQVLNRVDEELLGLAEVRAAPVEVVEACGAQAL